MPLRARSALPRLAHSQGVQGNDDCIPAVARAEVATVGCRKGHCQAGVGPPRQATLRKEIRDGRLSRVPTSDAQVNELAFAGQTAMALSRENPNCDEQPSAHIPGRE